MTLQERLRQAETEREQATQLQARAVQAANEAATSVVRLDGRIAVLKELIADEGQ